jgi:hypothetical protein
MVLVLHRDVERTETSSFLVRLLSTENDGS